MSLHVAIVGSGPAGFYAADALLKSDEGAKIRAAIGPTGERAIEQVEHVTGVPVAAASRSAAALAI